MYHIKSDKRSLASAAEIVRGLQECLQKTPLKSVTVTDIHRATGISRATFYRLFDTPEDVLIYQLDQMTQNAAAVLEERNDTPVGKLLEATISVGLQNHDFIKALVQNGRLDLLFRYTELSFQQLDAEKSIFSEGMDEAERDYIIAHLSMTMVATQITWARNGQKETAGDLLRYLQHYAWVLSNLLGRT